MSVTKETKEGTITGIYDSEYGELRQKDNNEILPFDQKGASVDFKVGDDVTFLRIGLYFFCSILSGVFFLFLVVIYLDVPGIPLSLCSVHSRIT